MSRKKTILRALGRVALRVFIATIRWIPLPTALAIGRGLGTLTRWVSGRRYRVALKNLRIAFGDALTEAERHRIAREAFKHFGMMAVEIMKFPFLSPQEVLRRIELTEEDYRLLCSLLERRKGCLLITAHLGNAEIASRVFILRGHELLALARDARDRGTTEILSRLRERMGVKVVRLRQSMKQVLSALKRNALVAILCDQNAADVFVPFFGHLTGTADGPARLALKMGAPMIFPYCVRDGKGGYRIIVTGSYLAEPTGDEKADIARAMAEVNRHLEQIIRAYPEQWLWFHDRWKSSPGVGHETPCP